MKKLLGLLCFSLIAFHLFGQTNQDGGIAIIPEPVMLTKTTGEYVLPKKIIIVSSTQPEMKQVLGLLHDRLSIPTGSKITVLNASQVATVRLVLNKKNDTTIGKEGYRLSVTKKGIFIRANEPVGLFYGAQTLVQLFPKEI
ncbi:MAG: glycoside hydrolase family 20 zincin-like fold domain-containing protein, partial [Mucilaginibacter sp.]